MRMFLELDEDGDGRLKGEEGREAARLMAAASQGAVKQLPGEVSAEEFMCYAIKVAQGSGLSVTRMLKAMRSPFEESVSELKRLGHENEQSKALRHVLVQNVSSIPDEPSPSLWRTATGSSFTLPPGAASKICEVAFKAMQYLALRTEDSGAIDAGLLPKMSCHRQMFKRLFDQGGEVVGVHLAETDVVDLYLSKGEGLLRVRLKDVKVEAVLEGIGGFDVGPVSEVPKELKEMIKPRLVRAPSTAEDDELQSCPLVISMQPVERHRFRLRLTLLSKKQAPNYLLLVPKLKTVQEGRARYAWHKVSLTGASPGVEFKSFWLFNLRGEELSKCVLQHEVLNQRVRVQLRASAQGEILPVPVLTEAEKANCLACDPKVLKTLTSLGLDRKGGERDIAYAMRLGRVLRTYGYDPAATEPHVADLSTTIWELKVGDCSAFNAGFVHALRAFQIPARVSLGFKYGTAIQEACGALVAPHAQAEFFAEGLGWVPCDATLGVHRFGHEATKLASFVEWRPANLELKEAREVLEVIEPLGEACFSML